MLQHAYRNNRPDPMTFVGSGGHGLARWTTSSALSTRRIIQYNLVVVDV